MFFLQTNQFVNTWRENSVEAMDMRASAKCLAFTRSKFSIGTLLSNWSRMQYGWWRTNPTLKFVKPKAPIAEKKLKWNKFWLWSKLLYCRTSILIHIFFRGWHDDLSINLLIEQRKPPLDILSCQQHYAKINNTFWFYSTYLTSISFVVMLKSE